jgi:hypothetical protein
MAPQSFGASGAKAKITKRSHQVLENKGFSTLHGQNWSTLRLIPKVAQASVCVPMSPRIYDVPENDKTKPLWLGNYCAFCQDRWFSTTGREGRPALIRRSRGIPRRRGLGFRDRRHGGRGWAKTNPLYPWKRWIYRGRWCSASGGEAAGPHGESTRRGAPTRFRSQPAVGGFTAPAGAGGTAETNRPPDSVELSS